MGSDYQGFIVLEICFVNLAIFTKDMLQNNAKCHEFCGLFLYTKKHTASVHSMIVKHGQVYTQHTNLLAALFWGHLCTTNQLLQILSSWCNYGRQYHVSEVKAWPPKVASDPPHQICETWTVGIFLPS